jgi:hypothetical protein
VIALIIFGTKGVTSTVSTGDFQCPACGARAPYEHKRVRRYFTLYWIPLIPLDTLGEFVQCLSCRTELDQGVLGGGGGG